MLPTYANPRWVKLFGAHVKTLRFHFEADLNSIEPITFHFSDLRQIYVDCLYPSSVERTKFWEQIGNTLEILKFELGASSEDIRQIQQFCRKLTSIDIGGRSDATAEFLNALLHTNNNSNMLQFTIPGMNQTELKNVVDN